MRVFWVPLLICGCVPLEFPPSYYYALQPENCGTPAEFKRCHLNSGNSLASTHSVGSVHNSSLPWSHRPYVTVEQQDAFPQEQTGAAPFSELGRGLAFPGASEPFIAFDGDATTPMAQSSPTERWTIEIVPGSRSFASGEYQLRDEFGTPTITKLFILEGSKAPDAPRGFMWRLIELSRTYWVEPPVQSDAGAG